jgi:hypothetical protein
MKYLVMVGNEVLSHKSDGKPDTEEMRAVVEAENPVGVIVYDSDFSYLPLLSSFEIKKKQILSQIKTNELNDSSPVARDLIERLDEIETRLRELEAKPI